MRIQLSRVKMQSSATPTRPRVNCLLSARVDYSQRLQNRAACIIVRRDSTSEALKTPDRVFRLQMFIVIHFIAIMI